LKRQLTFVWSRSPCLICRLKVYNHFHKKDTITLHSKPDKSSIQHPFPFTLFYFNIICLFMTGSCKSSLAFFAYKLNIYRHFSPSSTQNLKSNVSIPFIIPKSRFMNLQVPNSIAISWTSEQLSDFQEEYIIPFNAL
jgi:hypothetical protein